MSPVSTRCNFESLVVPGLFLWATSSWISLLGTSFLRSLFLPFSTLVASHSKKYLKTSAFFRLRGARAKPFLHSAWERRENFSKLCFVAHSLSHFLHNAFCSQCTVFQVSSSLDHSTPTTHGLSFRKHSFYNEAGTLNFPKYVSDDPCQEGPFTRQYKPHLSSRKSWEKDFVLYHRKMISAFCA